MTRHAQGEGADGTRLIPATPLATANKAEPIVGLANDAAASEALYEFEQLLLLDNQEYHSEESLTHRWELQKMQPLIEQIAARIDPDNAGRLKETESGWGWHKAHSETLRLIGILEQQTDYLRILGPVGPTLAADRLHRWVWNAAISLWDSGHFKQAVHAAATTVEEQTQLRLDRGDLSGADLYTQAFKVGKVGDAPDGRRLRFKHLEELTEDGKRNQSWVSAHEGAMHYGRGCAQGIRNLNAHGTGELPKQEALEYLAALSVLARWVHECRVVNAAEGAPAA